MSRKNTLVSVAVGGAFAATLGAAPLVHAAQNPFALQPLDQGYQVAEHNPSHTKAIKEGKCGEGKCGEGKCGAATKAKATKAPEAKCGAAMGGKGMEGKCGQAKPDAPK